MNEDVIEQRLRLLMQRRFDRPCELVAFAPLEEGHAGLTFGFTLLDDNGATTEYVLKLAPFGVRRRGNTDVYRQAPLLRALHSSGAPVPDIPFASDGDLDLGAPYIVMERLPGRTFVWEPHPDFSRTPDAVAPLWRQAAAALAQLHAFDAERRLAGWQPPRLPADELAYWHPILAKAPEQGWLDKGQDLAAALARSIPAPGPLGIVHGDYQPGNVLYQSGRLTGVIDWELSGIGAQTLDLGWLAMMADPLCWRAEWQPVAPVARAELVTLYEEARAMRVEHIDWFQALACYRLGAIACLNVRLHRNGRRPDTMWERFAPSITSLFDRGLELIGEKLVASTRGRC